MIDALAAMAADRTTWLVGGVPAVLPLRSWTGRTGAPRDVPARRAFRVPGLLQTEDYARAVFSYRFPNSPRVRSSCASSHRMRRRAVIEGADPDPLRERWSTKPPCASGSATARTRPAHPHPGTLGAGHITVRVIPFDLDGFAGAGSAMCTRVAPCPSWTPRHATPPTAPSSSTPKPSWAFEDSSVKWRASLDPDGSRDFIHRAGEGAVRHPMATPQTGGSRPTPAAATATPASNCLHPHHPPPPRERHPHHRPHHHPHPPHPPPERHTRRRPVTSPPRAEKP